MTRTDETKIQSVVQQLLFRLQADTRSSSEIARLAAVSQPTVSRMRRSEGKRQRISRSFNKLCGFYNVSLVELGKTTNGYNDLLKEAIIDTWDGTEAGGRALLAVIESLKGLNKK